MGNLAKSKTAADRWIQDAELERGSLRDYIQRNYGRDGFTQQGTIKRRLLRQLADGKNPKTGGHVQMKTRRRAVAAITLQNLAKKRKGGE